MAVAKLQKFLKDCKRNKNDNYNFVSLTGGRYFVKEDDFRKFMDLYINAVSHFSAKEFTSLAWRPPKNLDFQPLCVDLDIKLSKNIVIPNDVFIELSEWICDIVICKTKLDSVPIALTRRPKNYRQVDENGVTTWKTGFHAFFFNFLVTKQIAIQIREGFLPFLDELRQQYPIINSSEDIFDQKLKFLFFVILL